MVFAVALVISNVITAKTVQTGVPLFGSTILVPAAVICYCVTFLMTDVIGEIWGAKEARTVVLGGFCCQILATCLIMIGGALPAADAGSAARRINTAAARTASIFFRFIISSSEFIHFLHI